MHMKKWLPVLCLAVLASCQKSDDNDDPVTPPGETTRISLVTTEVMPGDAVEIKVNKKVPSGETTITFNSTAVKGYATGDSAYTFLVPVTAPGKVTVAVPAVAAANTVELTVKNYTPIDRPEEVFTEFAQKRQQSIDSLTRSSNGPQFQPSAATLTLLNQLQEEWALQVSKLSAADKQLLAYVLQKNMPNPAAYTFTPLEASNYARLSGVQGDAGDRLVGLAKEYVTFQVFTIASIPFMLITGKALFAAPSFVTGAAFLATFTTFIISREAAIRRAKEIGRLKGVAEAITDASAQKMTAVDFSNNTERTLSLSVAFRNLGAGDAGLHQDIGNAFSSEQTFAAKDREVEDLYSKLSNLFSKLKGSYPTYSTIIGQIPRGTLTTTIDGERIVVKSVSDPRISFTTSLADNTRKVKITSTATTAFDFTLKVAYTRSLDNQEFTRDIACTYNPTQYNYSLQVGDYHPDPNQIKVVSTLKKGDAFSTPNNMNRMVRLVLDGVPVSTWQSYRFGATPTSAAEINDPNYSVTLADNTNYRSATLTLNATLLNTAYANVVGKTLSVQMYLGTSKAGSPVTLTFHADGTLTRGGASSGTGTYNWISSTTPGWVQCVNYVMKDPIAGAIDLGGAGLTLKYLMINSDGTFRANSFYGCSDVYEHYEIY